MLQRIHAGFKRASNGQGFTLSELMIVVAIIGILAAIAIPNFLQYQARPRQTEGRTNVNGIKTGMVSVAGTLGCNPGIAEYPAPAKTGNFKTPWDPTAAALAVTAAFCTPGAGPWDGTFGDIGFNATGAVYYDYSVKSTALQGASGAGKPLSANVGQCVAPGAVVLAPTGTGTGVATNAGFQVYAAGDVDGNAIGSLFMADDLSAYTDCSPGQM